MEKISCENCGMQDSKNNWVGHKNKCSVGTFFCAEGPKFLTLLQADLNFRSAKKHILFQTKKSQVSTLSTSF